jgi:hypothetical protein
VTQDTTNTYRGSPGTASADDASLKLTVATSGTVTLKQTIDTMSISEINPNTPYFFRVMVNADIGTAAGGTVNIRCGSKTASQTIANLLTNNWVELRIGDDALPGAEDPSDCWPRNFNEDTFDVEIEWTGGTGGYLLVDDVIFVPWDFIDGTYWAIRANHATAPVSAKIQWWLFQAFGAYLPHTTGTETFTEP